MILNPKTPQASRSKGAVVNREMINNPTFVPSTDVTGNVQSISPADSYYALKVDTTNGAITTNKTIVLFDASQGFQLANGWTLPANVLITGITSNYQFMLNDISHNGSYVDILKVRVSDKPDEQFAQPINLYESTKGGAPRLVKTLYPEKGVTETQFQSNITTFRVDLILTNRHALVFEQVPGIISTFSFYQKGEIGRKI